MSGHSGYKYCKIPISSIAIDIRLIHLSLELTRQAGNDTALVGLMRVYKDYYPDVIIGDTSSRRASVFMVNYLLANLEHFPNS